MAGFFKIPHHVYRVLVSDPSAFRVYCELAARARWKAGTVLGSHGVVALQAGQCVMGRADVAKAVGITERAVRTAMTRLSDLSFLACESTERGTVVTLLVDSEDGQSDPAERPSPVAKNDQASTSKTAGSAPTSEEVKQEAKKEKKMPAPAIIALADLLASCIVANNPQHTLTLNGEAQRASTVAKWSLDIEMLHRLDRVPIVRIAEVITWSQQDGFWRGNILSGAKLRKNYNVLAGQMNAAPRRPPLPANRCEPKPAAAYVEQEL